MKKFLIYLSLLIISTAIIKGIYDESTKKGLSTKIKRIPCLSKVTSFERAYDKKGIEKAKEILKSGNYILSSDMDKAIYMESTLFNYINLKDTDKIVNNEIATYITKKDITKAPLKIEYKIYENDKGDPKKKSDNCKLFRGYVVMKFMNSKNKPLYQVQIDFMDQEGKDIPKTLSCAIKSFLTH